MLDESLKRTGCAGDQLPGQLHFLFAIQWLYPAPDCSGTAGQAGTGTAEFISISILGAASSVL